MSYVTCLRCRGCGREYPVEPLNACDFCFGPLEVEYDYDAITRVVSRERIVEGPPTMWRYQDFLPVDADMALDMGTGFTPLIRAENLGRKLGLENLYIKNDSVNPTFSFKDRVVSVASAKALEFEFDTLACASTGNLACAVAAHAARACDEGDPPRVRAERRAGAQDHLLGRGDALAKPLHIMDGAQIDARAPGLQIGKRREIAVIGTVENRNVDPIDAAARMGGEGVRHGDRAA